MAELKYVDWDGLVYYDGKIKEYIKDRDEVYVKMGGVVSFEELPDPSYYNLHYIYKINNKFTSTDRFDKPEHVYKAGTWVQCVDINNDASEYKYIIFNEHIEAAPSDVDLENYYTKHEVNELIRDAVNGIEQPDVDQFITSQELSDTLEDYVTDGELSILTEDIAGIETILEDKADKSELTELATKKSVDDLEKFTQEQLTVTASRINAVETNIDKQTERINAVVQDNINIGTRLLDAENVLNSIPTTYVTNETLQSDYITKEEIANTYVTEE